MALPGTSVSISDVVTPRAVQTDSGTAFFVGLTDRGPVDSPVAVRSLAQARRNLGDRVNYSNLYDSLEVFFREGGARAYVGRIVGPSANAASADLSDGTNNTLTVTAKSPGDWGNNLDVEVEAGETSGTVVLIVSEDGTVVERSPELANNTEAVAWTSSVSKLIDAADLGEGDPEAQTVSLSGGDDDRDNVTEDEVAVALALFDADLGPGQVLYPGATDTESQQAVAAHAVERGRVALLDGEDTSNASTLIAQATTLRDNGRFSALFAPWAVVPGPGGTTRTVPYSAVQAGLTARSDARTGNPNVAVAGDNGTCRYAVGLSQDAFSDADREALNDAGVNVAVVKAGLVKTYGNKSLVAAGSDPLWTQLSNSRLAMFIKNRAETVAESYLFAQIDGRGIKISEFAGDLQGILLPLYQIDALYGATPEEAFLVDVDSVNDDESLAEGVLNAAIAVKMSPSAERVIIEITKVATTEAL